MVRFFLLFLVIQGVLFTAELSRPVQQTLVEPFTAGVARVAAWLAGRFDPGVTAHDNLLVDGHSGFAVAIEAGCNGVEAMLVLAAALLAMPAPWRWKLSGLAVGFVAIQAMNQLRILSLFYLGQWHPALFQWAHLYLWQALIMLDVLVVFLLWLRRLPAPDHVS